MLWTDYMEWQQPQDNEQNKEREEQSQGTDKIQLQDFVQSHTVSCWEKIEQMEQKRETEDPHK